MTLQQKRNEHIRDENVQNCLDNQYLVEAYFIPDPTFYSTADPTSAHSSSSIHRKRGITLASS